MKCNPTMLTKYDEFGNTYYQFEKDSGVENNYGYTGKPLDKETDLYYYGARYYNPEWGRWVSRDLLTGRLNNSQSVNRYLYVLNNPLIYVDLFGLEEYLIFISYAGKKNEAEFRKAAETLKVELQEEDWFDANEDSVTITEVATGKDIVKAINSTEDGEIGGVYIFTHSGPQGVYLKENEGLYTKQGYETYVGTGLTGWLKGIFTGAARIDKIDKEKFSENAEFVFKGCNTARGENSMVEQMSKHLEIPVTGSQGYTHFAPNQQPGNFIWYDKGVPWNYQGPVYLVPTYNNQNWRTFND